MATRPVFLPAKTGKPFVREIPVEFKWFPGLAPSQKQKSIVSLHESVRKKFEDARPLEISSKSLDPVGIALSAFNLRLPLGGRPVSVEVAFQAGKKFERGGPYLDLLLRSSREAKKDPRLKESGRLLSFELLGEPWPTTPLTAFYDWLYLNALVANPDLADALPDYGAFTDIEFNPEKSINCQARSAALYVSLKRDGLLSEALSGKDAYLRIVASGASESAQGGLF
jgi:hypothetical protein